MCFRQAQMAVLTTTVVASLLPWPTLARLQTGGGEEGAPRVVGGAPVARALPWFALLHPAGHPPSMAICGGTLVSPRHVLTAAHCLPALLGRPAVTLGVRNRCLRRERGRTEEAVATAVAHPRWRPSNAGGNNLDDVAVLTLRRPAPAAYRPAALPPARPAAPGTLIEVPPSGGGVSWEPEAAGRAAQVAGFGERRHGDVRSQPCVLNVATVRVLSREECDLSAVPALYARQPSLLCAGRRGGGVDSCQGDSGGPLVVNEFGKDILIGIVAFGFGCGEPHTPGLYTRVASYLPWIREQMAVTPSPSKPGSKISNRSTAIHKRTPPPISSSTTDSSITQISSGAGNSVGHEGFLPMGSIDGAEDLSNLQGSYNPSGYYEGDENYGYSGSNWIPMYNAPDGTIQEVVGYNVMNTMQTNPGDDLSNAWGMWPSNWQSWPDWWESWPNWWQ